LAKTPSSNDDEPPIQLDLTDHRLVEQLKAWQVEQKFASHATKL
jgi:hypothetical protein